MYENIILIIRTQAAARGQKTSCCVVCVACRCRQCDKDMVLWLITEKISKFRH